ncbi:hypothetical protein [Intrasporangium calvum]|uniref:Uncharacterized protein n=1 Tax=Intrasporangium calvum (strain ATCC 23552 / DSM 43043 / JCM 3097 / NBRC 12989 / NCIMB 10167 / NRRL B-3866 / 7 KIP) TaxID=710696 RepID=E6S8L5_INTC7|nr:hypothetical protein [Intrasporangium calvum]ADU49177.1 hypothetical protein Intca_2675 [Intrasporangium calvum DSM 43043]
MSAKRSRPAGEPGGNKTFRGVTSIVPPADHDRPRELHRGTRTRSWCTRCRRPISGGYFGAQRHAAILGHAVEVVTEYWSTFGPLAALADEELLRREASR